MAFTNEDNAGFLVTAFKFNAGAHAAPLGVTHQRIVVKDPINAGGNVYPVGRALKLVDARVVARVLDMTSQDTIGATPANVETDVQEVNGSGTGSIIHGPMVTGNMDWTTDHANGAHYLELEYLLKGSSLTETTAL